MKVLTYRLCLEQPLLATQLAGDPNSSISLDYIPGSLVRGVLVHRYLRSKHMSVDTNLFDAQNGTEAARLFFSHTVRFLHAYPLAESGERLLPTPHGLLKPKARVIDKDHVGVTLNASHPDWSDEMRWGYERDGEEQLTALTYPFHRYDDAEQQLYLYELNPNQITVHVQRKRSVGRATRNDGAIFRYEALAAQQWFGGAIVFDEDADLTYVADLLGDPIVWLGRSRSAQYGRAKLYFKPDDDIKDSWNELSPAINAIAQAGRGGLLLLSDALLRDTNGQHTGQIDDETLSKYLGVEVSIDQAHTFTASAQIGGHNQAWQMPLPQVTALAAGSVIAFIARADIAASALAHLEWQGIGERRVEGFGRLAFIDQLPLEINSSVGALLSQQEAPPTLSPTAAALAQRMANRLLEQRIEENITGFVHRYVDSLSLDDLPKNSQLGRVRVLVRRAQVASAPGILADGLATFKDAGRAQFQRAPMKDTSLWDWLNRLLNEPALVWQELDLPDSAIPQVAEHGAARDTRITNIATLRLIEAVMTMPTRLRREEDQR